MPALPEVRRGFSLLELLVVIGVIAVLLALLLPALARARAAARRTQDLSNQREIARALTSYATDREVLPTLSNTAAALAADPRGERYRYDAGGNVLPWTEALRPYLGTGGRIFECPSDSGIDSGMGYLLPSDPDRGRLAVSYGLNADLAAADVQVGDVRRTLLGLDRDYIGVYGSDRTYPGDPYHGTGAGGKLSRVNDSSSTLLLADCGTLRPVLTVPSDLPLIDRPDVLAFTTNYVALNDGDPFKWGRLDGLLETPWLSTRLPLTRHDTDGELAAGNLVGTGLPPTGRGGVLNVAFVDGRAESVERARFARVKVTPFRLDRPPVD